jgi:ATP-dependent helicase/nuclease subunit B
MASARNKPSLFYIPAYLPFAETLANELYKEFGTDSGGLSRVTVLLPTRRAARTLREAFLRQTAGKPLLLPRMGSLGDIDADELTIRGSFSVEGEQTVPPAMPGLQRQFILSRLIGAMPGQGADISRNVALAGALGQLMDQVYTEDLNLSHLPNIAGTREFASHWNITVTFLEILSRQWPAILAERGVIDAADRRNRLIKAQAELWRIRPPETPVIAAGSTGSIPATAELLSVITHLPQGRVILPGLDPRMDDADWQSIDETHPQGTLKTLLKKMGVGRQDVRPFPNTEKISPRTEFIRDVMRPAETTENWQKLSESGQTNILYGEALKGVRRYDVKTRQEEADVIATIFRETLDSPGKTAALITPDRQLARRVAATCARWGIDLDDSAGTPLSETPLGAFLNLTRRIATQAFSPVGFLSLLRHDLCIIGKKYRDTLNRLDKEILRGIPRSGGWACVRSYVDQLQDTILKEDILSFIESVDFIFSDPVLSVPEKKTLAGWISGHIALTEKICPPDILWSGEQGEGAATLLAEMITYSPDLPLLTLREYEGIFDIMMRSISVRRTYGMHPRLIILGQLESRMYGADIMILSGLNEGTWPPAAPNDPFMSRPMRSDFGLPSPERSIGLSAHDFVQAFHAPEIYLTRAERIDGTPTVPARWLSRMDTVIRAAGRDPVSIRGTYHPALTAAMDRPGSITPATRPEPRPPADARPKSLSVTRIDTWLSNPYGLYAEKILHLKRLKPLEQSFDAAARGTILHKTIERWGALPAGSATAENFITLARAEVSTLDLPLTSWTLWEPRLRRAGQWLSEQEAKWQNDWRPGPKEASGRLPITTGSGHAFTLTAIADRIDLSRDGQFAAIIDYKSAGTYTQNGLKAARHTQLPLESAILTGGGFSSIPARPAAHLGYWVVSGGSVPGKIVEVTDKADVDSAQEKALSMLTRLIDTFADPHTPYYCLPRPAFAPRYDDYALLARVKEWASLDEEGDAAA